MDGLYMKSSSTLIQVCRVAYWEMYLWVKKKLNVNFDSCPLKQNSPLGSYHHPPGRWKLSISPRQHIFKTCFPLCRREKEGGNYEKAEKVTKIKSGHWSQVLINTISFAPFPFFDTVLLYHNLDSSMLKYEGLKLK